VEQEDEGEGENAEENLEEIEPEEQLDDRFTFDELIGN